MKKYFFFILFLILSYTLQAQFVKIDKKALQFLTSEQKVNVVFENENILFNADNLSESEFLTHINKKITHHKDSIIAKIWQDSYYLHKSIENQKAFIETLNVYSEKYNHIPKFVINEDSCQYTLKIDTNWMYYGYDAGVTSQPAKLTITISFFKTNSPDIIIDNAIMKKVKGFAYPDKKPPMPRLKSMQNSYTNAAHKLALTLKKIKH